jgi:hypothetical protein
MTLIPTTLERVRHAAGLAATLDVAYEAFEDMLQLLRAHEDPASALFLPIMVAAATAADGRDAIMFAPSLPPGQSSGASMTEDAAHAGQSAQTAGDSAGSAADAVAGLARLLAARLAQSGQSAADPGDQSACSSAAGCAEEIYRLLRRTGP